MPQIDYWLSVELSTPQGSLCLHEVSQGSLRLLGECWLGDSGKHSEKLIPSLQALLDETKTPFASISRFIATSGPGSFTGLRVGLAALKAFALATRKPIELLDGQECRALAYLKMAPSERLSVATQITRDSYLLTVFKSGAEGLTKESEQTVASLENALQPLLLDREGNQGTAFPLLARHLAEGLLQSGSRQTLDDAAKTAAATPLYFGSKF